MSTPNPTAPHRNGLFFSRRWPAASLVGLVGVPMLLAAAVAYYCAFAADLDSYSPDSGLFQYALNSHDHLVYADRVERTRQEYLVFELGNDNGIALIFVALSTLLPFLVGPDYTLLALVFNCATLIVTYRVWVVLCDELDLGAAGRAAFFLNWSVLYFAQLINKDMLTILAFLLALRWSLQSRLLPMLLAVPLFMLVRQQLAVFFFLLMLLSSRERPIPMMLALYLVTSIGAGVLTTALPIIGFDSLGGGFSLFLHDFNQRYVIGYLLFNPLRVVQYVFDALISFQVLTPTGGLEVARLLRWPQLLLLMVMARPLSTLVTDWRGVLRSDERAFVLVVFAYLLAWLMNPTVNARYVMLITPVLVLYALRVRRLRALQAA